MAAVMTEAIIQYLDKQRQANIAQLSAAAMAARTWCGLLRMRSTSWPTTGWLASAPLGRRSGSQREVAPARHGQKHHRRHPSNANSG